MQLRAGDDQILTTRDGHSRPLERSATAPSIGFSTADSMAIDAMPDFVRAHAEPAMHQLATDLAAEGGRGGAARRLLARDVAIRRARLRYLEGLETVRLNHAASGDNTSLQQAAALDKLVEAEHRRLLASLDALVRLEPAPAVVNVRAHQAAVVVNR